MSTKRKIFDRSRLDEADLTLFWHLASFILIATYVYTQARIEDVPGQLPAVLNVYPTAIYTVTYLLAAPFGFLIPGNLCRNMIATGLMGVMLVGLAGYRSDFI